MSEKVIIGCPLEPSEQSELILPPGAMILSVVGGPHGKGPYALVEGVMRRHGVSQGPILYVLAPKDKNDGVQKKISLRLVECTLGSKEIEFDVKDFEFLGSIEREDNGIYYVIHIFYRDMGYLG